MERLVKSCVIGAAIGDALGVPFEFKSREVMKDNPATTMIGRGTHNQPIGTWSDDTSMILATMDAIVSGLDYNRIMHNFSLWLYDAEFTPRGLVFDVGRTTDYAISKYKRANTPALECGDNGEKANGNGSLMRIVPFALYCHLKNKKCVLDERTSVVIHRGSSLTHSHPRSQMACGIYASIVFSLLKKQEKRSIYMGLKKAHKFYSRQGEYKSELKCFTNLFEKDFGKFESSLIKSSGYVVDSLEAAIWCALSTNSYEESVLKAVNLGGDTDTIASITGGLTGLLYGIECIPNEWKEHLLRMDYIEDLCNSFVKAY